MTSGFDTFFLFLRLWTTTVSLLDFSYIYFYPSKYIFLTENILEAVDTLLYLYCKNIEFIFADFASDVSKISVNVSENY